MHMVRAVRLSAALLLVSLIASPAFAVNKDMVQLQTQIQQLQDAVARLQQSNDERMGVLKDLVQQSADSVNRMSVNIDVLQKQLATQQAAQGAKVDGVSGQVQALNDSLDEMKARMIRLEKVLGDVQSQQQGFSATLQSLPQVSAVTASNSAASTLPPAAGMTPAPMTSSAPVDRRAPAASTALPVQDLYKSAYNDYMAAKYPVAAAEFGDIIKSYPSDTLAGNAFYYLGEIDYRAGRYGGAAANYDRLLEQFPDNNKIPAAHLHKGEALLALKETDAGIRELRALIQRFPSSPEATQARTRLSTLGVPVRPRG